VKVARPAAQCPHNTAKMHKVQCNAPLYVCLTCAGGGEGGQASSAVPTQHGKMHKVQCNAPLYVSLMCAGGGGQGSNAVPT